MILLFELMKEEKKGKENYLGNNMTFFKSRISYPGFDFIIIIQITTVNDSVKEFFLPVKFTISRGERGGGVVLAFPRLQNRGAEGIYV